MGESDSGLHEHTNFSHSDCSRSGCTLAGSKRADADRGYRVFSHEFGIVGKLAKVSDYQGDSQECLEFTAHCAGHRCENKRQRARKNKKHKRTSTSGPSNRLKRRDKERARSTQHGASVPHRKQAGAEDVVGRPRACQRPVPPSTLFLTHYYYVVHTRSSG